ncbi:MAG TPA: ATP-binding protein [Patescibacteria group bacterium]|nr:ATP-binding protein [Patescibacteria group bacterium]
MFKSARIKLTLFYLAVLVAFSLVVTFSIRILAEREYLQSNLVQRGEVHQIIVKLPGYARFNRPTDDFVDFQQDQEAQVRSQLNQDLLYINISALIVSVAFSYWFAGRTLKPIEEAHKAQARFAADASHELRTPLTSLKLENEVFLRQKTFTEQEARELIASNLEEVQRLEGLSSNLLALTQYGNTPLKLGGVPAKRLVDSAVKLAAPVAAKKKVQLKNEAAVAMIRGHHDSLAQLLNILLDNAIKYGPEKGTVTIGGRVEDGQYLLWVQDEGPGIAEQDLPHIFERLYRGDTARTSKAGGYGLGLSLARAIAGANGAEIRAVNTKTGACLMVRIPVVK